MLDDFDVALLNSLQRDSSQTAYSLAEQVPLSPSAIARRLRRLRTEGWIARTIALLSPRLSRRRLKAIVLVQLSEHANKSGKQALLDRIAKTEQVQLCYEMTGSYDFLLLVDSSDMDEFTQIAESVLVSDPTVRRYETSFVKREIKFAPFVKLGQIP